MDLKAVVVVGPGSIGHPPARGACTIPALEPVANRPIIHHVLDELRAASVSELIVVGEPAPLAAVRKSLGGHDASAEQLQYAVCEPGLDMAAALRSVTRLVGYAPCFVQPADGLLGEPIGSVLNSLGQGRPDLILPVADLTAPLDPGHPALAGSTGTGSRMREDPTAEIAVFGPGALERATHGLGRDERADLAIIAERLAAAGGSVRFQLVESWRRYSGNGTDLLELNRIALDGLIPDVRPSLRTENRIEGRVSIHPTASARASVIIGPAVIGEGARVENAYIGPYTSVGAGARIEGAEIERSILSPGASVMHIGGRLVSSLVGRDARVFRDFSLPRAMRLRVGDGDEVALC